MVRILTASWRKLVLVLSLSWLAGCQQVGLSAVNLPTYANLDLEVKRDLAYGDEAYQRLDAYLPGADVKGPVPLVIFLHGGSWTDGQKGDYRFLGDRLAKNGIGLIVPDYRKYPNVVFPAFMEDAAKAVAWVHRELKTIDARLGPIHLMGHSAGAHMGGLLVSDERYLEAEHTSPDVIETFIGLAGPYDFTPEEKPYTEIFGPEDNYPNSRAIRFLDGDEPPMLLLHGTNDTLVGIANQDRLAAAVKTKGGTVETRIYDGVDHIGMISAFAWLYAKGSPVVGDVIAHIKSAPDS